jgi:pyrroline-5-carboxylate reductase
MEQPVLAFLGAGNMARSLIHGLLQQGHPPERIWASNHDAEKTQALQNEFQIHVTTDNIAAAKQAEVIIFAVKPQTLALVVPEVAAVLQQRKPLIISIAAGVRIAHFETWLGAHLPIVRCMPNTPALVQASATGLFASRDVLPESRDLAESLLRAVGLVVWLDDEKDLDVVTALSGSGPAYFFLVMEAMIAAGVELGLSPKTSQLLTLQTAVGAAHIAMQANGDIMQLRERVTSKGGTTERAIEVLEQGRLRQLFLHAISAATDRARELAGDNINDRT